MDQNDKNQLIGAILIMIGGLIVGGIMILMGLGVINF